MAVIRVNAESNLSDRGAVLTRDLISELTRTDEGLGQPFVFETTNDDRVDVTVVWERWRLISESERVSVIRNAYKTAAPRKFDMLFLIDGHTTIEAVRLGLLPYQVVQPDQSVGGDTPAARTMRSVGGVDLPDNTTVLFLPSRPMAERALAICSSEGGRWEIRELTKEYIDSLP